jgi:hypothetical protein
MRLLSTAIADALRLAQEHGIANDQATRSLIARRIIDLANKGERDPVKLREVGWPSVTQARPPRVGAVVLSGPDRMIDVVLRGRAIGQLRVTDELAGASFGTVVRIHALRARGSHQQQGGRDTESTIFVDFVLADRGGLSISHWPSLAAPDGISIAELLAVGMRQEDTAVI